MRLDLIEESDLPVTVGRYRLTALLGEGGMARVFKAEMAGDLGFRKPAAVKVVLPARGEKAVELRQQLIQEARVGGLLNHPNVVQTFDCGELEGFPYIAMELVDGVGLGELVGSAGPLPPALVLDLAIQTLRGLHHAHGATHEGRSLEVVHRDIKPSNILVRGDGVVKLVDFGIAKASVADAQTTASGMTKGTPAYMSPEQLAAEPLDRRTDLFTLGAVIWFALTGRTLFGGASLTEVMMRIINVEQTLEQQGAIEIADRLASGLGQVLTKLLARDRSDRYATAAEAEQALAQVVTEVTAADSTLSEVVAEHFPNRLAGTGGPYLRNWTSSPGRAVGEVAASLSAPPDLLGGGVGPTVAMPAAPGPGATRAFPANVPEASLLPDGAVPTSSPTVEDWPFTRNPEEARDEEFEEIPLSTQSRPAFRMPPTPPPPEPAPPPEDAARRQKRARRLREQDRAIQSQRRLLLVLGGVVGAMAVLLGFFGWQTAMERLDAKKEPVAEPATPAPTPEVATPEPEKATPKVQRERTTPRPRREPSTPRVVEEPVTAAAREPDTPAPTPAAVEEPVTEAAVAEVTPEPEVTPAPEVVAPALKIDHSGLKRAVMGQSKFVEVKVSVVDGTEASLFWGPEGGPHTSKTMRHVEGGTFRCTLSFDQPGKIEYWIIVRNADAEPPRLMSGSRFKPHVVAVY